MSKTISSFREVSVSNWMSISSEGTTEITNLLPQWFNNMKLDVCPSYWELYAHFMSQGQIFLNILHVLLAYFC